MIRQNPVIILDQPQLPRNIGMVARAMLNFELSELRLISPPLGWYNENTIALSAGADQVLAHAKTFDSLDDCAHDLHYLYATTARIRHMVKKIYTPREVATIITKQTQENVKVGIVFGSEKSGLDNDAIALTNDLIRIPTNDEFSSLNLAQSVLTIAYELLTSRSQSTLESTPGFQDDLAPRQDLDGFLSQLLESLDDSGYFRTQHKQKVMSRNLINIFTRIPLTTQEVRTLRGVISTLTNPNGIFSRKRKKTE